MNETNGRAEVLRAAGFPDAAALLERLDAIDEQAAAEADQPRPEPQTTVADPEAAQRAEAQYLLDCLRRDLPGLVKGRED